MNKELKHFLIGLAVLLVAIALLCGVCFCFKLFGIMTLVLPVAVMLILYIGLHFICFCIDVGEMCCSEWGKND